MGWIFFSEPVFAALIGKVFLGTQNQFEGQVKMLTWQWHANILGHWICCFS